MSKERDWVFSVKAFQYWGFAFLALAVALVLSFVYEWLTGDDTYVRATKSVTHKIVHGFIVVVLMFFVLQNIFRG